VQRASFERRLRACAFATACFGVAGSALAQVNVEPLRRDLKTHGFSGHITGSFDGLTGNTEGVTAGGALLVGVHAGRHFAYLDATADYSRINHQTQVAKSFAHLREDVQLADWLWSEYFAQLETDHFRRIQLRELVGTGPRFRLFETEELSAFYGTAYMLEHTHLSYDPNAPAVLSETAERWSNYLALAYQVGKRVLMTNTTYYEPRISDFDDFHLLSVTALEFKITPILSSGVSLSVHYESRVPSDVKPTDVEVKNALDLKF
jgi:Protein of unknown function, DUF481